MTSFTRLLTKWMIFIYSLPRWFWEWFLILLCHWFRSRLGCQVTVNCWMDGMTVCVPQEIKDQRGKQEAQSSKWYIDAHTWFLFHLLHSQMSFLLRTCIFGYFTSIIWQTERGLTSTQTFSSSRTIEEDI